MTKLQKTANLIATVNEIATIARKREIAHLFAQDEKFNGRDITLNGRSHINFGSCSYLGLEFHPSIIESGIDAIRRYGSQFSSSRTYVSIPLYEELEELLQKMFGKPVILATSSTMGHQAVIPIIVDDDDAVILDQQAHVSMQEAATKLQLRGVTVTVLRHSRLDDLQNKIDELSQGHKRVWYFIDGVYSMYGDFAPVRELTEMLNKNKQLHLYVDDAHGMSWTGKHGSGYTMSQVEIHPKMVLATSLAKGFASAGGVFVLPDEEMYWKVKNWGGPLTYSGPQQPAVIGASIASAKIHLSDEIYQHQKALAEKIRFCNEILSHYELPVVSESDGPIFFVGLGLTKVGYNMVKRLSDEGFYVNIGIFPAVPETCTGIRFTLTNHHQLTDIEELAEGIRYHLPKALKEEDRSMKDIHRAFKSLSKLKSKDSDVADQERIQITNSKTSPFKLVHKRTIADIPEKLWDDLLGENGSYDWKALRLLEDSFQGNPKPEDNWEFHYYLINDKDDKPVIATFFTSLLVKDDLLSPEDVSFKIEQMRIDNPYHLTSKAFMMGSILTDGDHLFIDKGNSKWKEALMVLLDEIWTEQERQKAGMLFLRDFRRDDDEIKDFLIDQGFIKVDVPDAHVIDNKCNLDLNAYVDQLSSKKRYHIRHDVLKHQSLFDVKVVESATDEEIDHWYELYDKVKCKNLEINTFPMPRKLFQNIAKSPEWDVIAIYLNRQTAPVANRLPVAVGFSYKNNNYSPVLIGIDYKYMDKYNLYKQMLFQFLTRGVEFNARKIYLGLTTSLEKRKLGASAIPKMAFVQMKDSYNMSLINLIPNTKNKQKVSI